VLTSRAQPMRLAQQHWTVDTCVCALVKERAVGDQLDYALVVHCAMQHRVRWDKRLLVYTCRNK
jgi:hypothetical protein